MKVFCCKNQCSYSGGLILVAANTKEEAFSIASINEWFEVEHLSTDLSEPQVIIEDHYSE